MNHICIPTDGLHMSVRGKLWIRRQRYCERDRRFKGSKNRDNKGTRRKKEAENVGELKDIAGAVGKLIEKDMAENGVGRECARQRVFALIRDKLENAH